MRNVQGLATVEDQISLLTVWLDPGGIGLWTTRTLWSLAGVRPSSCAAASRSQNIKHPIARGFAIQSDLSASIHTQGSLGQK